MSNSWHLGRFSIPGNGAVYSLLVITILCSTQCSHIRGNRVTPVILTEPYKTFEIGYVVTTNIVATGYANIDTMRCRIIKRNDAIERSVQELERQNVTSDILVFDSYPEDALKQVTPVYLYETSKGLFITKGSASLYWLMIPATPQIGVTWSNHIYSVSSIFDIRTESIFGTERTVIEVRESNQNEPPFKEYDTYLWASGLGLIYAEWHGIHVLIDPNGNIVDQKFELLYYKTYK